MHPIRLVVDGALRRSRLTVFFRLPLAVVHLVWLALWSVVLYVAMVVGWLVTLVRGRLPAPLHRFAAAYVRYVVHVTAFLFLAANPFPGFTGAPGSYPVDVEIDPPERQNRWKTGFRLILAIPAGMLVTTLAAGSLTVSTRSFSANFSLLWSAAFLAWFVALARGAITPGLRDAMLLALAYAAQELSYVLLLTDRYPVEDPERLISAEPPSDRWAQVVLGNDDGSRYRFGVLIRAVIVLPLLVWFFLWGLVMAVVVLLNWFALLAIGRSPAPFHRMITAFIRYGLSVVAFTELLADEYPWFIPRRDERYVVDVEFGPLLAQSRWRTLFRGLLVLPAYVLASAYSGVLFTAAFLGWFVALILGRMPNGLRKLGLACLNYMTQMYAYMWLVTDQYPYSGPAASWAVSQPMPRPTHPRSPNRR